MWPLFKNIWNRFPFSPTFITQSLVPVPKSQIIEGTKSPIEVLNIWFDTVRVIGTLDLTEVRVNAGASFVPTTSSTPVT